MLVKERGMREDGGAIGQRPGWGGGLGGRKKMPHWRGAAMGLWWGDDVVRGGRDGS